MPKYLVEARYAAEGAVGLAREGGSARRVAVARTVERGLKSWRRSISLSATSTPTMIIDLRTTPPHRLAYCEPNWLYREQDHRAYTADEMDQAAKKTVEFRPQADDAIPVSTGFDERYTLLSNDGQRISRAR